MCVQDARWPGVTWTLHCMLVLCVCTCACILRDVCVMLGRLAVCIHKQTTELLFNACYVMWRCVVACAKSVQRNLGEKPLVKVKKHPCHIFKNTKNIHCRLWLLRFTCKQDVSICAIFPPTLKILVEKVTISADLELRRTSFIIIEISPTAKSFHWLENCCYFVVFKRQMLWTCLTRQWANTHPSTDQVANHKETVLANYLVKGIWSYS